jgi:hypothetical protein
MVGLFLSRPCNLKEVVMELEINKLLNMEKYNIFEYSDF